MSAREDVIRDTQVFLMACGKDLSVGLHYITTSLGSFNLRSSSIQHLTFIQNRLITDKPILLETEKQDELKRKRQT